MVGEVVSTEDEKELEEFGTKTSEQIKVAKRTKPIEKITSEAKRRKKCVPKKNNETEKPTEVTVDEEDHSLPTDVCKTKENDEKKNDNVKKMRPQKEKKRLMEKEDCL